MTKPQQNDLIHKGRVLRLKIHKEYLRGERAIVIDNVGEDLTPPHYQFSYITLDYDIALLAIHDLGGANA